MIRSGLIAATIGMAGLINAGGGGISQTRKRQIKYESGDMSEQRMRWYMDGIPFQGEKEKARRLRQMQKRKPHVA